MKITLFIAAAALVVGLSCMLGPDMARYLKIRSM